MNVFMRFNTLHPNENYSNYKRDKYVNFHTKLKNQGKLFRKKHEVETILNNKEKDANEYCNIYLSENMKNDSYCMVLWEDIENLEIKLKNINKQLNLKKYKNKL